MNHQSILKSRTLKISPEGLSEYDQAIYQKLNAEVYGKELATKVCEKLMKMDYIQGLHLSHRDYCGIGIFLSGDQFVLCLVPDGWGMDNILTIGSQESFISWLASESDQSMSLYGHEFNNQTITQIRLKWFLEDHYSPSWNDYVYDVNQLKDIQ